MPSAYRDKNYSFSKQLIFSSINVKFIGVYIKYFKNIFINYIHVKKYIKENIYL